MLTAWQHFTAAYTPQRTDDLVPGALPLIGTRMAWHAAWQLDQGVYAGDWACAPSTVRERPWPFGWVPLCDLADIEMETEEHDDDD